MKTITIDVPEETYKIFQEYANRHEQNASELIINAMEEYKRKYLKQEKSIFDQSPANTGGILKDFSIDDDLLEEML